MTDIVLAARPADGVLQLTLNRPEARNALSRAVIHRLAEALSAADADAAVRCAVLTGGAQVFSAGADIKEFVDAGGPEVLDNAQRNADWAAIERFSKPLVAAVEGYAFGGGHELMLVCDIIIAAEDARFGQPEIKIGVLPGDGGTQRVTRIAGKPLAMWMMLTGDPIGAEDALHAGLVSKLVPPGNAFAEALAVAERLSRLPPVALALAKQAVLAAYATGLPAGLAFERQVVLRAFATEDRIEGMSAFRDKRPPAFKGR